MLIIIINNNSTVTGSVCFIDMNPSPPMYVMHTRLEYLESFQSLMFCLKLTRELLFFIFAGSCCYSFKSTRHGLSQPTIEIPRISYCIWDVSQPKYFIHNRGRYTFRYLKISINSFRIVLI